MNTWPKPGAPCGKWKLPRTELRLVASNPAPRQGNPEGVNWRCACCDGMILVSEIAGARVLGGELNMQAATQFTSEFMRCASCGAVAAHFVDGRWKTLNGA